MSNYPEHEKLAAIQRESQACGEFVEWLQERGVLLATWYNGSQLAPCQEPITRLLALYFEIDEDKIEAEKRAMLEELRRGADEERARAEAAASDSEARATAEAEGLAGFEAGRQP